MDYFYVGYTDKKEVVKGRISATCEKVAVQMLADSRCQVLSLKPISPAMPTFSALFSLFSRVKQAEIIMFSRQLAILLESGIGIMPSLELLKDQAQSRAFKKTLNEVISDLRGGSPLSEAVGKHPRVFGPIFCKMITVGEQTGGLEVILRQLADHMEKEEKAAQKIKNALTYPVIVFLLAIVVLIVLVTVALPPLVAIFASLGSELPLTTRLLIAVMGFLKEQGVALVLAGWIAIGLIISYIKRPAGRYKLDKILLSLPLIGRPQLLNQLARCCRSFSLLLRAGLPLPEIMNLLVQTSNNQAVAKSLTEVRKQMLKGEGLSRPMGQDRMFLPLMVQMVKVGEETGNLDATLLTVAETYETEADHRIQSLITLIEPAMTILMGLFVAAIALSMIVPLYSLLGKMG